jgi:RNA polymerase sigma-70 factor (ECF subfamily)
MLRVITDPDKEAAEAALPVPDHAEGVVLAIDVAAALLEIPEEFRIALVMADVQDLPYDEIARVLEVPVGTVKSRVFRGRAALGRALGGPGGEPSRASRASEEEA